MKYVITDHNKIAFGSGTNHSELVRALSGNMQGAGYIDLKAGEIYGGSALYGCEATEDDAKYLSDFLDMPITLNKSREVK